MSLDPKLSEVDGGPVKYAPSLWAALQDCFEKNSTRDAVVAMHQDPAHLASLVGESKSKSPYLTWTFDQLLRGSVALAAAWKDAGIVTGDVIATLIPNGADHCILRMAGIISKLNFVAIDMAMATPAREQELQGLLVLLKPTIVVVADSTTAKGVDSALSVTQLSPRLKLDANWEKAESLLDGWVNLDQIHSGKNVDAGTRAHLLTEALHDDHERICAVLFTSGTSMGKPKGCPRTVRNAIHSLYGAPQRLPGVWTVRLVDTANFRAICNSVAVTTWIDNGTFVVSSAKPSAASMIRAFHETKVTDTFLLPALVRLIAAHPEYSVDKVKTVTTIGVGGDVVTRPMMEMIESVFPESKAYNIHGSSEGTNIFDWTLFDRPQRYYSEVPSFGPVHAGVRAKAVDEQGNIVPRGTPGELHISSGGIVPYYLENVNQASFYDDGKRRWFNTGDTVVIDEDGFVFMVGRTKDIIKRIGVPITPGVIETCLSAFAHAVVVVVDIPHEAYGAEPFAIMSTFRGKSLDELKGRVVEMLGADYGLGGAVLLEDLGFEAWPLNETGKIHKVKLKAALKSHLGM